MSSFYIVTDYDELDRAFATRAEAIAAARFHNAPDELGDVGNAVVKRVEISRLTREILARIYNHEGYAKRCETVLIPERGRRA